MGLHGDLVSPVAGAREKRHPVARAIAALALALGFASLAHAQPGPFFEPGALEPMGYELRISADYHDVRREDFSRPQFLFSQKLEQLRVRQGLLQFDLRFSITPAIAVQLVLPWVVRGADVRTAGLQVSETQRLPPRDLNLTSWGLADPRLVAGYRMFRLKPWAAYAEVGTSVPIDDNPGSSVLPTRVPLSTGQRVWFVSAGATLDQPIAASLAYRFSYFPGEHATYLIRRVANQSFTSGALAAFTQHRIDGAAELSLTRMFSLRLAPSLTFSEVPLLVERVGTRQLLRELWYAELDLNAAIRMRLGAAQTLELHLALPLLRASDIDPFFPIAVPAQGLGITWSVAGS